MAVAAREAPVVCWRRAVKKFVRKKERCEGIVGGGEGGMDGGQGDGLMPGGERPVSSLCFGIRQSDGSSCCLRLVYVEVTLRSLPLHNAAGRRGSSAVTLLAGVASSPV